MGEELEGSFRWVPTTVVVPRPGVESLERVRDEFGRIAPIRGAIVKWIGILMERRRALRAG